MKKATDQEIISAYDMFKSVWKAGEFLGMGGQSVHERLQKLGHKLKGAKFTEAEKNKIRAAYAAAGELGSVNLRKLTKSLGRDHHTNIARTARELGLTTYGRHRSEVDKMKQGKRAKAWIKKNGHPRGMLGKKHSAETIASYSAISADNYKNLTPEQKHQKVMKMLKTKEAKGNLHMPRQKTTWKSGWYEFNGKKIFMRSSWEYNYALILEKRAALKIITKWEYEPETFWFEEIRRGTRSYKPDFKVFFPDGTHEFHEIKGWYDARSKTQMKRMAKYHPAVKVVLIQAKEYKAIIKRGI